MTNKELRKYCKENKMKYLTSTNGKHFAVKTVLFEGIIKYEEVEITKAIEKVIYSD